MMSDDQPVSLQSLLDEIGLVSKKWFQSQVFAALKKELRYAAAPLPKTKSFVVEVAVKMRDSELDDDEPVFIRTWLQLTADDESLQVEQDVVLERYAVDGSICELPFWTCPNCLGDWSLKFREPHCPQCGVSFGQEVKILLDSERCPMCNENKMSIQNLKCDGCGFEISPEFVWKG